MLTERTPRTTTLGIAMSAALFCIAAPAKAELTVLEYACALGIADRQPAQVLDCAGINPVGSFYLWTKVRGELGDLQALEQGRSIKIKYRWKRYVGASPEIATVEAETEIGAGAIPPAVLDALKREVATRGFFDWRTWTHNELGRKAGYSVNILDTEYKNIPCATNSAAADCKILVKVGK